MIAAPDSVSRKRPGWQKRGAEEGCVGGEGGHEFAAMCSRSKANLRNAAFAWSAAPADGFPTM